MTIALEIAPEVGISSACRALEVSRATLYRRRRPREVALRSRPGRALSEEQRQEVLAVLNSKRFVDASPRAVHATLLSEGVYLASVSTMYRVLRGADAVRERRAITRHPNYPRPELVARAPNELWTWDITKIRGPERRDWFHLYVVLDVYSRFVVGWMLAASETASLAERFLSETLEKHGVGENLVLHADRGTSMRSKTVAELLDDLGVTRSHSRPRVSNDNPFSESQFKTMKYSPYFPDRFSSIEEGRSFLRLFVPWYNDEHHHSGIAMLTPRTVFTGAVDDVLAARQAALAAAYAAHPERFVKGPPRVARPPTEVWINRPDHHTVQPHSGITEPSLEASVRPSSIATDRLEEPEAAERPEPPGPTRSAQREHGEDGEDATWPQATTVVPGVGEGRIGADLPDSPLGQRM